ncbi:head-tail adaptor protein [Clostridium tetani]|uniref:phage head closure protein n=1 Tax=Clostridium tetani TaxID=1513 RepID=UPI00100C1CA8|nr:phage head closure protein [Clostridium tetani]RXM73644.1 head-tail adaptor protein [Clostridium tetani]RYU97809.1 head-tail adaptor protein [Clostridium tetani]
MKTISHVKDKKITIMERINVEDEDGFTTQKLEPLPGAENIWAYYRHAKASEFYEAAKLNTKIECIFEINWKNDIDVTMKIKYKNQLYDISQIDDFEGYKESLKIYAYKID